MVVDRFIFKINQITLSACFTFMPKTGVGLPKIGVSFYCVVRLGQRSCLVRFADERWIKKGGKSLQLHCIGFAYLDQKQLSLLE